MYPQDYPLQVARSYITALEYKAPGIDYSKLLEASRQEIESWGLGDDAKGALKALDVGAGNVEPCYLKHPFEVKVVLSVMTCIAVWIDNTAGQNLEALEAFQHCYHTRQKQKLPLLDAFARYLLKLYDFYEPLIADRMVSALIGFVSGCCLEERSLGPDLVTSKDAGLWPYYVRNLSGIATFYALGSYPRSKHPNMLKYIQAIPEFEYWINITNDILSFWKEELAGEENNLICAMARQAHKHPHRILDDLEAEILQTRNRIRRILKDEPKALEAFEVYANGFVWFHLNLKRYQLPQDLLTTWQPAAVPNNSSASGAWLTCTIE